MKKKKTGAMFSALLGIGLFLTIQTVAMPSAASAADTPEMIGIITMRVGSSAHIMSSALGEVLKEKTGKDIRITPIASQKARMSLLRGGSAQFSKLPGNAMFFLQCALEEYCKYDWGVQPMRLVWMGNAYNCMLTTKKHKDINSIADVKGKRLTIYPQKSSNIGEEAYLAYAGLTWKDVTLTPVAGYMAQFKALMAGQTDVVGVANPATSMLYELEASPKGLKWLPMPFKNKEGWKRLRKIAPWGMPGTTDIGPGISKEKPLECFRQSYSFVAYESTDPDLVYMITKTIGENLERLGSMTKSWKAYTRELALSIGYPHVYHAGAIRYFKEKGLWTAKHEQWNQRQIDIQTKINDAWKATIAQGKAEKWSEEKLKKHWYAKQKEITGFSISE